MSTSNEEKVLSLAIEKISPDEPNDAYQGFLCFVQFRGKERSTERVAKNLGYSGATISHWHKVYQWSKRADQVDAQRWLIEHNERQAAMEADNQHFIQENREVKRRSIELSTKMLNVANNLLDKAELSGKVIETDKVETKDGRTVALNTTIEMRSKVSDIPRLVEVAVKVARLASDLPTDLLPERELSTENLHELSTDQLLQLRKDNAEELIRLGIEDKLSSPVN